MAVFKVAGFQLAATERRWSVTADGFFGVDESLICRVIRLSLCLITICLVSVMSQTGFFADVHLPPYLRCFPAPSYKRCAVILKYFYNCP